MCVCACKECQRSKKKKKKEAPKQKKSLKPPNKQRTPNPIQSCFWTQYFKLCKVQYSKEDLIYTYQDMVVLIPFFYILQIKRADLEPEILSSTEETELFYNRGI